MLDQTRPTSRQLIHDVWLLVITTGTVDHYIILLVYSQSNYWQFNIRTEERDKAKWDLTATAASPITLILCFFYLVYIVSFPRVIYLIIFDCSYSFNHYCYMKGHCSVSLGWPFDCETKFPHIPSAFLPCFTLLFYFYRHFSEDRSVWIKINIQHCQDWLQKTAYFLSVTFRKNSDLQFSSLIRL